MGNSIWLKITLGLALTTVFFQNCSDNYRLHGAFHSGGNDLASNQIFKTPGELAQEQSNLIYDLKYKSCMFNSLIYPGVEDLQEYTAMLKRSNCSSLPRAIETWNNPPNFSKIQEQIQIISSNTGKNLKYGMFIAESIKLDSKYTDDSGRPFDFAAMCEANSQGRWGQGTCVPSTATPEYQRYLRYIVNKALDVGVTDILFGQLDYLDVGRKLPSLISEFKNLAVTKGKAVIFGGQPNTLPTDSYLKNFDYIITPLYVDRDTSNPRASGSPSNCMVVWYHDQILAKSNLVIAEFDWSSIDDDIHRFARKNLEERKAYIVSMRERLTKNGSGLILPFRIPLNGGSNGNCYGYNQWVYGASSHYTCGDEIYLNSVLDGTLTQIPPRVDTPSTNTGTPTTEVHSKTISAGTLELAVDKPIEITNVKLLLQGDGNLVIYQKMDGRALWASGGTVKNCFVSACKTSFQNDGNLVQYLNGAPYWASNSVGATQLVLQDQAPYLKIIDSSGSIVWSSNGGTTGSGSGTTEVRSKTISAGSLELAVDLPLEIANVKLLQQGDGNLVVYSKINGSALWSTRISGKNCYTSVCKTVFQGDGNLVQYLDKAPYWASNSVGAAKLIFQDIAPYLKIVDGTGRTIWTSGN